MSTKPGKLRKEYPAALIQSGVRGKYAKKYLEDNNLIVIDPDLRAQFPDSTAVNKALRNYLAQQKAARQP
jgi:hypothetical protein